jgi:hypothetical protein
VPAHVPLLAWLSTSVQECPLQISVLTKFERNFQSGLSSWGMRVTSSWRKYWELLCHFVHKPTYWQIKPNVETLFITIVTSNQVLSNR